MRNVRIYTFILALLLLPVMIFAFGGKEEKSATAPSSGEVKVAPDWGFSWRFLPTEIEFTVTAPTTGWVGIGFNPSYMMKDADYILGYVKGGTLYVQDNFGTGNTSHAPDVSLGGTNNVRGITGTEANGLTTIVFAVPLDSKDIHDKKFIRGTTYMVLLGYGRENADDFTSMHAKRMSVETVLK